MINKIGKITIYVGDQAVAKTFWTEKVGFVVKAENPMGPNLTWLEIAPSMDEITTFVLYPRELMLKQNPGAVAHPSVILSTENIDDTYATFKERGIKVDELQKMPYGSMFSFYDEDGQRFLVRQD